jgi:hypothetical protein
MSSAGSGYRVRFTSVRSTFQSTLRAPLRPVRPAKRDVAVGTGLFEAEVLISTGGAEPGV